MKAFSLLAACLFLALLSPVRAQTLTSIAYPPSSTEICQPLVYNGSGLTDGAQARYLSSVDYRSVIQTFTWGSSSRLVGVGFYVAPDQNVAGGVSFLSNQSYAVDVQRLDSSDPLNVTSTVATVAFTLTPALVQPSRYVFIKFATPLTLARGANYGLNLRPTAIVANNRLLVGHTNTTGAGGYGVVSAQYPGVGYGNQFATIGAIGTGATYPKAGGGGYDLTFFAAAEPLTNRPYAQTSIDQPIGYDGAGVTDGVQARFTAVGDYRSIIQTFDWATGDKLTGIGLLVADDQNAPGGVSFTTDQYFVLDVQTLDAANPNLVTATVATLGVTLTPANVQPGQYIYLKFPSPLSLTSGGHYGFNLRPTQAIATNRLLLASSGITSGGGAGLVSDSYPGVGYANQYATTGAIPVGSPYTKAGSGGYDFCFYTSSDAALPQVSGAMVLRAVYGPPNSYFTYPHSNGFWRPDTINWGTGTFVMATQQLNNVTRLSAFDPNNSKESYLSAYTMRQFYSISDAGLALVVTNAHQLAYLDLTSGGAATVVYAPAAGGWTLAEGADITADGTTAAITMTHYDPPLAYKVQKVDIATGTATTLRDAPWPVDHAQFSPPSNGWIAYCHNADNISDRMWAWNSTVAPSSRNLFNQIGTNGLHLEMGHERAMFHKAGMVVCAYKDSPGTPRGLYEVNFDLSYRCVSSGDAWHCNISRNGKWAVIDTQDGSGVSRVIAVNFATGARQTLCTTSSDEHPYHPHPHISPDGKWVIFNDYNQRKAVALEIDQTQLAAFAP